MKRDKQATNFAKALLKMSLDENAQISEERALAILQTLEKNPPRGYAAILKVFLKLVERELAKSTAVVEHAGAMSATASASIASKLSAHYGRSITVASRQNDSLIAGLRVRVGCDLYENSVAGSLEELRASLS
ncbi:F0F1 ATP synthase subunit delta [Pelagicoccus sp. SDUM812003]|uniref:F0F1 ATP synthase subunit delta n=1 Tax=Pelagicoccus sp. SDUM812003 TaxID=3041267 RepID=UPI00280FEF64|nr:F0F1 ATP synthase subunit delta [Pelagicoccus sp. SDUM812003]MDQ8204240.1 F0F1 ATP synthase subunit delta [Pelagicoccus sp. SDUM812003]